MVKRCFSIAGDLWEDCITSLISITTCSWVDLLEVEESLSLQNLNPSSSENLEKKSVKLCFQTVYHKREDELYYVSRLCLCINNLFGFLLLRYCYNNSKKMLLDQPSRPFHSL